jgi:hypothetical protein
MMTNGPWPRSWLLPHAGLRGVDGPLGRGAACGRVFLNAWFGNLHTGTLAMRIEKRRLVSMPPRINVSG